MRVGQGVIRTRKQRKNGKYHPHTKLYNGLVWFQTKKKKKRKSKKRSEKSHHTCMFSIIHVFYIKQTC